MLVACIVTQAYRAEYVAWITIEDPRRVPTPQGLLAKHELPLSRLFSLEGMLYWGGTSNLKQLQPCRFKLES